MDKRLGQTQPQREYPNCQKAFKGCLASLDIGEMQIRTTVSYLYPPSRMAKIALQYQANVNENMGQRELLQRECKLAQSLWNNTWQCVVKLKICMPQ